MHRSHAAFAGDAEKFESSSEEGGLGHVARPWYTRPHET
jgi:hypothetical protein